MAGFIDSLDYLQSMGIKGIYIIGTIFQALPWSYDGYAAEFVTLDSILYQLMPLGTIHFSANTQAQ